MSIIAPVRIYQSLSGHTALVVRVRLRLASNFALQVAETVSSLLFRLAQGGYPRSDSASPQPQFHRNMTDKEREIEITVYSHKKGIVFLEDCFHDYMKTQSQAFVSKSPLASENCSFIVDVGINTHLPKINNSRPPFLIRTSPTPGSVTVR